MLDDQSHVHSVVASTFADEADVERYRRALEHGYSEADALKFGDNGRGCWGDDTTSTFQPVCALPYEDWKQFGRAARGKRVKVTYKNQGVYGELRDTMPHRQQIRNGAGIDLNPGFCKAFGLTPPFLLDGFTWEWSV